MSLTPCSRCRIAPTLAFLLAGTLSSPAFAALVSLSGTVTDENDVGIFGVQINFVDSCTGVTAAASGNLSSSTGTFRAIVNGGTYDLEFVPPAGSLFAAHRIRAFDLTVSRTLAPIPLPYGITVSGRVIDATGAGVAGVFARFFPPGSSERIFTVRDRTDLSGNYSVVVRPGTYDVKYGPPLGTHFLGVVVPSVPIPANTSLPPVTLVTGLLVSGKILSSNGAGQPIINVNIDVINFATGQKLFLPHDRTDATGAYSLAVPPGTYLIDYKPQPCSLLIAQEAGPVEVAADVALPPLTLAPGVLVQGTVTDARGAPIADVNTNYIGSGGIQVFTLDDHTDASGVYRAIVPRDTYNIDYAPPAGLRFAGVKKIEIQIGGSVTLPPVQLPDGVVISGRTVRATGEPLAGIDLDLFDRAVTGSPKVYTSNDLTNTAGRFSVVVVPGVYDVRFEPPSTSTLAAKRLRSLTVSGDLALGDVIILQGYTVSGRVTDASGTGVSNADLDFFDFHTGEKIETLHDNTDLAGYYSVIVPARLYNLEAVPPADVPLETGQISGVSVTSNVSGLDMVLGAAVPVTGGLRDPFGQGVGGADLDFFPSGSEVQQTTSRDDTSLDGSGSFAVYVPPGIYDIAFVPPSISGLAPATLAGVSVAGDTDLGDIFLGWAQAVTLTSIDPSSGPASGGTAVTILGSGFQEGAKAMLGGFRLLDLRVLSDALISALTPALPLSPSGASGAPGSSVDVTVANWGAPAAMLPGAFTSTPAPVPVRLSATRSVPSIVLSWEPTGQVRYTVLRSSSPSLFGPDQVLAIIDGTRTAFSDVGADTDGVTYFYRVE